MIACGKTITDMSGREHLVKHVRASPASRDKEAPRRQRCSHSQDQSERQEEVERRVTVELVEQPGVIQALRAPFSVSECQRKDPTFQPSAAHSIINSF